MSIPTNLLVLGLIGGFLMTIGGAASTWLLLIPKNEQDRLWRLAEREKRARENEIKYLARKLRPQIVENLSNQGFRRTVQRQNGRAKIEKPHLSLALVTQDAIMYRLARLPDGNFTQLVEDPHIVKNLEIGIGRECRFWADIELGLWLQIGLKSGFAAIPRFFPWYSEREPHNARELLHVTKPLTIAIGVTENRRFVYADIRDMIHLLIGGSTGGGKSTFVNQALCTLISRNSPDRLQIVLIDLKGGLEFGMYESIPHLRQPIITNRDDVAEAIEELIAEKSKRFNLLRNAQVRNIEGWNHVRADKLPYILFVVDELANLMLLSQTRKLVERLLADIAQQGRAVGIFIWLATQYPSADIIPSIIKANLPSVIAFSTNAVGSMVILGNGMADGLPLGGRLVFRSPGANELICQGPIMTEEQSKEIITNLTAVPAGTATATDLFKRALESLNGSFSYRDVYNLFDGSVPERMIRQVSADYQFDFQTHEPVITVGEQRYILGTVKHRNSRVRKLLPIHSNDDLPKNQDELEALAARGMNIPTTTAEPVPKKRGRPKSE